MSKKKCKEWQWSPRDSVHTRVVNSRLYTMKRENDFEIHELMISHLGLAVCRECNHEGDCSQFK